MTYTTQGWHQHANTNLSIGDIGGIRAMDDQIATLSVNGGLGYTPVNKAGDTMTGILNLGTSSALVDGTTWSTRTLGGIGQTMSNAGSATPNSANEHAVVLQIKASSTSSAAAYQKTGILIQAQTDDVSTATVRNMVALDTRGIVGAANTNGRVWSHYSQVQILTGGDGNLFGYENVIINEGTDVSTPGTNLQKVGYLLTARGTNPSTVGIALSNADTGYWHHGFYSTTASLGTGATDSFLELVNKFTVRPTGFVEFGNAGPQIGYGANTPEGAVTAPVGSVFLRTNGGAGTSFYVKESGSGNTGWVGK